MREEIQRQQQLMLNDLHILKHEANTVKHERTNAQYEYVQLKQQIHTQNGLPNIRNAVPSYLQEHGSSIALNRSNLKVQDYGLNNDSKRVYQNDNPGRRIYESTKQLKERNVGIDDIMDDGLESNKFFDKFLSDLSDIETINSRVERDIQFRTQQRIQRFGADGKRILGIHIAVPVQKTIEPFERLTQSNIEREQQINEDMYYMKKLIDKEELGQDNEETKHVAEEKIDIKNSNVYMGQSEQVAPV